MQRWVLQDQARRVFFVSSGAWGWELADLRGTGRCVFAAGLQALAAGRLAGSEGTGLELGPEVC